jgi:hypothetical protein
MMVRDLLQVSKEGSMAAEVCKIRPVATVQYGLAVCGWCDLPTQGSIAIVLWVMRLYTVAHERHHKWLVGSLVGMWQVPPCTYARDLQ